MIKFSEWLNLREDIANSTEKSKAKRLSMSGVINANSKPSTKQSRVYT